ncbi:hypothetical protein GN958_ATG14732 [Phytophthora infestans]|uniref:Uncharacterized protein n=2 Tax=Phytophthora infestans TaxID=4787 RepID=A0A8S9UAW0_PHYIN|nr:hypothetical protein GN958_ATG14732 [Phytophthora infestans]
MVVQFPLRFRTLSALFHLLRPSHKDDTMSAEPTQHLLDKRGDGFDAVRVKLLHLIKFHDAIGYAMNAKAEQVDTDKRLMSCLRLTAAVSKEPKQEEKQSSISYVLAMQVLESAQQSNELTEELKAQCAYLRALLREQQERKHPQPDEMPCIVILFVVAAIWYLFFR